MNVGIVDLLSGQYVDYSEDKLQTAQELQDVMYASFSPIAFVPPAEVFGSSYVDGAAVWDIDIFSAINRCEVLGFKEENIVVDVLLTVDKKVEYEDTENFNSIHMLYRFLQIARYYGAMDGLTRAQFAYPNVNFRYVIGPQTKLEKERNPLSLNAEQMQAMFAQGRQDALDAIAKGEGSTMTHFVDHYTNEVKYQFKKDISTKEKFEQFNLKEELSYIEQKLNELNLLA